MTTAPELRSMTPSEGYIDAKGGVRCWRCNRVLHKVSIDPDNRPQMVEGRKCGHCGSYSILDYSRIRIEGVHR